MGHKKKILLQNNDNIKYSHIKILERERELKRNQLSDVPPSKKFRSSDLHRIIRFTNSSIFDPVKCCLWQGYITNLTNKKKGTYINFYFKNKKKVALHRLLYANFKGEIKKKNYIKFTCPNNGICCNINHMVLFETINDVAEIEPKKDTKIEEYDENIFKITIF